MSHRAEYFFHKHLRLQSGIIRIIHPISSSPGFLTWAYRPIWRSELPRKLLQEKDSMSGRAFAGKDVNCATSIFICQKLFLLRFICCCFHKFSFSLSGRELYKQDMLLNISSHGFKGPSLLHLSPFTWKGGRKGCLSVCVSVWVWETSQVKHFQVPLFSLRKEVLPSIFHIHTHLHPPHWSRLPLGTLICFTLSGIFSFSTHRVSARDS